MKNFILAITTVMLCVAESLAHDVEIDGIYYNLNEINKTAEVTYRGSFHDDYSNEYSGSVTIPETITYNSEIYSVTSIGRYALRGCSGLTEVTIGKSVTSIESYAFYDCSGLTSVTIPNSVTSIGYEAFRGCSGLTSVTIGNSVTSIESYAFYDCSGLTSVTIPNSVTSISSSAFYGCSGLTKVNYLGIVDKWVKIDFNSPNSNPTYYAKDLYINNELLTDVKITTADSIKDYAFNNCQSIKSAEIGSSVTSIGKYAFSSCSGLTSVTIGESVTSIGSEAFYGCSGLTSVTIGNSVTSIESYAFYDCSGLTSVTIPNSVTSISSSAFYGCSGLTKVNYLGIVDKWVKIDFNSPHSNPTCYAEDLYINNELLTDVKITTADSIKNYAFHNCQSIKSVEIGESVTSIGSEAFYGCSGLTSVTIGNSVTSIESYAFYDCSGLTSVTIPNSVTSIGDEAFSWCRGLTSVTIPNSVTSIGYEAFRGCSGLTSVTIGNSVTSIESYAFYDCSGLTSVTIPNSVTSISSSAFYGCSGLTKVNYLGIVDKWVKIDFNSPHSNPTCYAEDLYINNELLTDVKITTADSIKNYAFYYCKSIKSVEIGNNVTYIGEKAFYNTGIYNSESNRDNGVLYIDNCLIQANPSVVKGSYTIKEGTRVISGSAFYNCSNLSSITIPNSVTSIGSSAFYGCSGLTKVNYLGNVDKWVKIDFNSPNSNPTYYAKDLYINNELLTDVKITTADSIKDYAFNNCQSIKSAEIGSSVTSIGKYAFSSCSGLTSVTIGESVTSIGSEAFYGCSGLTSVVWNAKNCEDFSSYLYSPFYNQFYNIHSNIKSFTFGNEVEHIPAYLCHEMSNLKTITIPNSVTSIGDGAFEGCSALTSVTIGESVTSISNGAFGGCSGLTSVTIPNSVTSIGSRAFRGCSGLTSVTIGESVTSISNGAFYNCSGLTSVTIGESVTSIGDDAFYNCSGLTKVNYLGSVDKWVEIDFYSSSFASNPTSYAKDLYINNELLTDVKITTADSIKNDAFYTCQSIKSVEIGESVTFISNGAFGGCRGLTSVIWNAKNCEDFKYDSYYMEYTSPFYNIRSNITSFTFGNEVEHIPAYLCYGMSGLKKISVPTNVKSIGDKSFYECYNLKKVRNFSGLDIVIGETTHGCVAYYAYVVGNKIEGDFVYDNNDVITEYIGDLNITSITIPLKAKGIVKTVFTECTKLISVVWNAKNCEDFSFPTYSPFYEICSNITSFTFGNEVEHIPAYLCYGMSKLVEITFPNSVTSIGDGAFEGCSGLTSVTIPTSITSIGGGAFRYCIGLTSVTIPNSVTSIGSYAFSGCSGLTEILVSSNNDEFSSEKWCFV